MPLLILEDPAVLATDGMRPNTSGFSTSQIFSGCRRCMYRWARTYMKSNT